jgi:nitrite reductase (NADH) small subunit/3-phenylpropionate/trans-cinnamate dioxygenase ferredoxin subunit
MAFVKLISVDRCPPGRGIFIPFRGLELAVFHLTDPTRFVVIDNACPHAGANLSGGSVEGATVECPWHKWRFDLDRAVCIESDRARLTRYPTEVRNGDLYFDPEAVPWPDP